MATRKKTRRKSVKRKSNSIEQRLMRMGHRITDLESDVSILKKGKAPKLGYSK